MLDWQVSTRECQRVITREATRLESIGHLQSKRALSPKPVLSSRAPAQASNKVAPCPVSTLYDFLAALDVSRVGSCYLHGSTAEEPSEILIYTLCTGSDPSTLSND